VAIIVKTMYSGVVASTTQTDLHAHHRSISKIVKVFCLISHKRANETSNAPIYLCTMRSFKVYPNLSKCLTLCCHDGDQNRVFLEGNIRLLSYFLFGAFGMFFDKHSA